MNTAHQLTQLSCNFCGQPGIRPRVSTYEDRYNQELITEADWICHRCGNRFESGIVSRQPIKKNER